MNETNNKEDLSKVELLIIAEITTATKEIITDGLTSGKSQEEITELLNKVIPKNIKLLPEYLREEARKTIVRSCKKWYFELNQSLNVYTRNLTNQIGISYTGQAYKTIMQEFRPYLEAGENVIVPTIKNYQQEVRQALSMIASESPVAIQQTTGQAPRKVSLRNLAEMKVRYEANLKDLVRLKNQNVKLVWTSSHPNCSPRCKDFQGKLWSLDNTSGEINGVKYRPIEEALQGKNKDGNGIISGYNCRHRLVEYTGQPAPNDYTDKEIRKEYALDEKQRNYENRIRHLKTEERLFRKSGDSDFAKQKRAKWQRLTKSYQKFCIQNDRAFYRWRCSITRENL